MAAPKLPARCRSAPLPRAVSTPLLASALLALGVMMSDRGFAVLQAGSAGSRRVAVAEEGAASIGDVRQRSRKLRIPTNRPNFERDELVNDNDRPGSRQQSTRPASVDELDDTSASDEFDSGDATQVEQKGTRSAANGTNRTWSKRSGQRKEVFVSIRADVNTMSLAANMSIAIERTGEFYSCSVGPKALFKAIKAAAFCAADLTTGITDSAPTAGKILVMTPKRQDILFRVDGKLPGSGQMSAEIQLHSQLLKRSLPDRTDPHSCRVRNDTNIGELAGFIRATALQKGLVTLMCIGPPALKQAVSAVMLAQMFDRYNPNDVLVMVPDIVEDGDIDDVMRIRVIWL